MAKDIQRKVMQDNIQGNQSVVWSGISQNEKKLYDKNIIVYQIKTERKWSKKYNKKKKKKEKTRKEKKRKKKKELGNQLSLKVTRSIQLD